MSHPAPPTYVETGTTSFIPIVVARGVRSFVDGLCLVALPTYLLANGANAAQVGAIITAAMLGSAIATVVVAHAARTRGTSPLLILASILMIATGLGFSLSTSIGLLFVIAIVGTLNTYAGDTSVFIPLEQASIATLTDDTSRPKAMARLDLVAVLSLAAGTACAGVINACGEALGLSSTTALRANFVLYAFGGLLVLVTYLRWRPPQWGTTTTTKIDRATRSRVRTLSLLFSLDSLGSGFASHAVIALWLYARFDLSPAVVGAVFSCTAIAAACSAQLSPLLVTRLGSIRTMVFTHIPSSLMLVGVALSPHISIALILFVARGLTSRLDAPIRASFVMSIVPAEYRASAAAVTNVPRSFTAALPAAFAGWMIGRYEFAWPLIICAALKLTYDLLLLRTQTHVHGVE